MTIDREQLLFLLSERTELQRILARMPQDNVITRGSLQARLEVVESKISEAGAEVREPTDKAAALLKLSESHG